ncbi:hypothetical protein [Pseudalkalibacillus berkeleyi]|uniref:Uncharacterized protein n=1 Tax=Pseudalkalibacillus berkeleyi TaxID=1069813 RepID=A0ABS9GUJ6_9BACL|nr:hypothetical protein [Pseudalkalibacillus berkeleyi]MCF6136512.1 hypothetical protein [Pseudalkalibacillus berkeleyi]
MSETKAKNPVKKPTGVRSKFGTGVSGTPVRNADTNPGACSCSSGCGAATKVKK